MAPTSSISLEKFNPDDPTHVAEFRRQRVLSWGTDKVDLLVEQDRAGGKSLYWAFPADPSSVSIPEQEPMFEGGGFGPPPPNPSFQPIGHVSLDWEDFHSPPQLALADRAHSRMTLSTFFVLVSQQGKCFGGRVMDAAERLAGELGARELTLNVTAARDAGRKEYWASLGIPQDPTGKMLNEHWYARRGFVAFESDVPLHPIVDPTTGEPHVMCVVLMRKYLVPQA